MTINKPSSTTVSSVFKQAGSWIASLIKNRHFLILLGILALGAFLRLWNIEHLFNAIHDYDEGIYALSARFIAEGYMPYRDFLLVSPPLHSFALASVYSVFGYSFFYGRYLSVAFSLASIIFIYLSGKKLYHPRAGLAAAALFAVSPEIMYYGRRIVLEPLALLLITIAIYFAADYINTRKDSKLLWCGFALGLALATKYLLLPAVIAIILAVALLTMRDGFWQSLKSLGRPMLWLAYLSFAAIFYSLVLILKWVLRADIAVPFIDQMYITPSNLIVVVLVFVLPFLIAWLVIERRLPSRRWWLALWGLRRQGGLWLLLGGTVLGFLCIAGFYLVTTPQEFIQQTVLMQANRQDTQFPSFTGLIALVFQSRSFLRMAFLPALLVPVLILVLLNKERFAKADCFLAVSMITSFLLCQMLPYLPRYYASVTPFFFLGLAWLIPRIDTKTITARVTAGTLVILAIFILSLNLSIALLKNYTGYDVSWAWLSSREEQAYKESLDYLEGAGDEKIYSTNPILPALSTKLASTPAFDTYALLWLEEKPPEKIVTDLTDEGVSYVIVDPWIRSWTTPYYTEQAKGLATELRRNGRLMKVVEPNSLAMMEIYKLGASKQGIFNGDFSQWVSGKDRSIPLGWEPTLIKGEGDEASISKAYVEDRQCVRLTIYEDGNTNGDNEDYTYAAIVQNILFPESKITAQILAEESATPSALPLPTTGIHFRDNAGHSLVIGFSDRVDGEEIVKYQQGYWMLVLKEAKLHQWSEEVIDVARYWSEAGWPQPKEVDMAVIVVAHTDNPGWHELCISKVWITQQ